MKVDFADHPPAYATVVWLVVSLSIVPVGYCSVTGALDTSIAIRTAIAPAGRGRVYFSAGGGIVADSDPEQEYRETLHKARGMIDALSVPA